MTLVPFQKTQSQDIYAIISSFLRSVTLALLIHTKGIVRMVVYISTNETEKEITRKQSKHE
jgi:hypothetical protein